MVDLFIEGLERQKIDNFGFYANRGAHRAMQGDSDAAFDDLQKAVDGGWVGFADRLSEVPELESLYDDPRLLTMQAQVAATIDRDRAVVGLPPLLSSDSVVP